MGMLTKQARLEPVRPVPHLYHRERHRERTCPHTPTLSETSFRSADRKAGAEQVPVGAEAVGREDLNNHRERAPDPNTNE